MLLLVPLFLIQRRLHFETQAVFLLITRRGDVAAALFALVLFPGVLLHEASHYLAARLLGVRTGRFSLLPASQPNGQLRLGYVETEKTDLFRDALIGAAPLITGGIFVAFAGLYRLNLGKVWESLRSSDLPVVIDQLANIAHQPDFWLWFYLTVAVSSTMMPSAADRRAWAPLALILVVTILLGFLAGAGPWLFANLLPMINRGFQAVAVILGLSSLLQGVLLFPAWLLRMAISNLTKLKVA